jgi:hypothetical protein
MPCSELLRLVALVRMDVSKECSASTIKVTTHSVTSQKTALFTVTAVKTSSLACSQVYHIYVQVDIFNLNRTK